jgi:hypothetical protein
MTIAILPMNIHFICNASIGVGAPVHVRTDEVIYNFEWETSYACAVHINSTAPAPHHTEEEPVAEDVHGGGHKGILGFVIVLCLFSLMGGAIIVVAERQRGPNAFKFRKLETTAADQRH